jgi:hypothetical protein
MKVRQMLEYLKQQSEGSASLFEKEVMLRVEGREYAIRSIDTSTSDLVLWGGEEIIHEDTRPGIGDMPGGLEGEGVEPEPPGEALREAEQITPVAEVVPDEVLDKEKER